jgi:serine/threonine-protein kinase SRPK3
LPDVLREKYHFTVDEAKRISEFLLPMLELEPSKRANAGGMVTDPFLDKTPGMDGIKINGVVHGSKGEGIEGWACEIKKTR